MREAVIEFRNVTKSYGAGNVLEQFNLIIPKGRIVTLIGPSGCGKTTLLKMINRLVEVDSGSVLVEGRDISGLDPVRLRREIGYVIQQIGLFPHMTIEDNITIVPRLKGKRKKEQGKRAEELLRLVGLDPATFRTRYPHELSGGQQQRIGVARALAAEPSIILMDEPFSALDPISRVQLQNELIRLNEAVKKTIVFVTHDIDEALKIADEVVLLKDGKIVQAAAPDELLRQPADDYVKEFVGAERYASPASSLVSRSAIAASAERRSKAKDWLTPPVSIEHSGTVDEAVFLLDEFGAYGLVVTDENRQYAGVLSADELHAVRKADGSIPVGRLIPSDAPQASEHTTTEELLELLKRYPAVPIFDSRRKLAGIVTRVGMLEASANRMEREGASA